jgi:hypothetical protein
MQEMKCRDCEIFNPDEDCDFEDGVAGCTLDAWKETLLQKDQAASGEVADVQEREGAGQVFPEGRNAAN